MSAGAGEGRASHQSSALAWRETSDQSGDAALLQKGVASSLQALSGVFPASLGGLYPPTAIGRSVFAQPKDFKPLGSEVFVNEAVC